MDSQTPYAPACLRPHAPTTHGLVAALARALESVRPTPVAVLADNGPALALLELACLRAGRPWLPIPGFFSVEQQRALLARCRPGTLIGTGVDALVDGDPQRAAPLVGLPRFECDDARELPGVDVLTCTSGSTGDPGVVLHRRDALERVARSLAEVTGFGHSDRHLAVLPMAVLLESVGGLHRSRLAGAKLLLPSLADVGVQGSSGFDPAALDACVRRLGATSLILMPAQLAAWTELLETERRSAPASLRFVGVGGAPGPASVLERARAVELPVSEGYGLSEACSVVCLDVERSSPAGSVGRALPHVELQLAPDGELLARGALCVGRLDAPDPVRADGWLPTGDLAERDDAGRYWIRGRKDLRFATPYGRNVSPEWLERALLELPGVEQAVVFGHGLPGPVALLGPGPTGWSAAQRARLDAALATLAAGLPDYARPVATHVLPHALRSADGLWTATGRPRRAALWQRYGAELRALAAHPTDLPARSCSAPSP